MDQKTLCARVSAQGLFCCGGILVSTVHANLPMTRDTDQTVVAVSAVYSMGEQLRGTTDTMRRQDG